MSRGHSPMQRFMEKVRIEDGGCWIWLGSMDGVKLFSTNKDSIRGNYGRFALDGYHMMPAHRASYLLFKGKIRAKMDIAHSCDRPICVNPKHLSQMSRQENVDDQVRKGRAYFQRPGWISPSTGTGLGHKIDGRSGTFVDTVCIVCNSNAVQHVVSFKCGKPASCSKKCLGVYMSACQRMEKIKTNCARCKKTMLIYPYVHKKSKNNYCSKYCLWNRNRRTI